MMIDRFDTSNKVFIIAELSANHGHDINVAKNAIRAAKAAGADAIKLQTYTADTITIDCDNEYFQIKQGTLWDGVTLYDLYKEAYTPWEWHEELFKTAHESDLIIFSSPFDKTSVDFLEKLSVPVYKIASFEIKDIPLIEYVASKGKPVIISTGIATLGEIEEAIQTCIKAGNDQIVLLKCTSSYPAKIEDANLKTIPNLKETFKTEVGLSDHTTGIVAPVVSVALGARVIEKHFIIDRNIGGPDADFSLNAQEFKKMVECVREAELSLGRIDYSLDDGKQSSRNFSRSLFVVEDIKKGEVFSENNVRSIRPGYGLPPKYIDEVLGSKAKMDISRGTPLYWTLID